MDQFQVNYSQIGLLDSIASFTAGLIILVSGMIMYRWGARNIAIIGFIIAIIAQVLFAVVGTFPLLIMVRLLMGVGIGMIFVAPYNMTVRWFEQTDHTAFALGVMLAADGAGMLIALYLLAFIYMATSWFVGTFVGAIFIAVVFVLVCRWNMCLYLPVLGQYIDSGILDPGGTDGICGMERIHIRTSRITVRSCRNSFSGRWIDH